MSRQRCGSPRILCFGQDCARSDILLAPDHPAANAISFRISYGLHAFGAEPSGTRGGFAARSNEKTERTKINCDISHTQTLFNPWQGASLALMGLVTGQWSDDVLLPAEQSYLGGSRFTRGDYAGQIVGDCRPWSVPSMAMYAPR